MNPTSPYWTTSPLPASGGEVRDDVLIAYSDVLIPVRRSPPGAHAGGIAEG